MISVPSMQQLLEAGVHFGHKVSRGNPRMKGYIFGARDGVHIIDLEQSEAKLKEAVQAAHDLGQQGKTLLIVGTKKQAQEMVKELAESVGAKYVNVRWPGGLLTNFDELRKNFQKLSSLHDQQQKGELSRTKREQLLISRKLGKFSDELGGVAQMDKVPDVLLVIDAVSDLIAVKEARRMGLTIIGLCDSNADPTWFDYPVPANDDGIKSIKIIAETLVAAFKEGQAKAEAKLKAEETKKAEQEAAQKAADEAEPTPVIAAETAAIEEEVEKKIVKESERVV